MEEKTFISSQSSPFLIGKKVLLRGIELEDAEFLCQGENNEAVRDALFLYFPQTVSKAKEKIEAWQKDPNQIVFIIQSKEDNAKIGQTAFFRIDFVSRSAIFYLALLDPQFWGQGIGTEATSLMVKYGFETLNLNRIQLHVNSENIPAIKIYQKIGFQKEGVLRQAMYKNGRYFDFWVMGILRSEWGK